MPAKVSVNFFTCLIVFVGLLGCPQAWANPSQISRWRTSVDSQRLRIVAELDKDTDFHVYASAQPPQICVEFLNTSSVQANLPAVPRCRLVQSWRLSYPNMRRVRLEINLQKPLPADQYRVLKLNDPYRVALDIATSWQTQETYQLTDEVTWNRQESLAATGKYLLWNTLRFNPQNRAIHLDIGLPEKGINSTEAVSSIVERNDALAGTNGGYFNRTGGALGLVVKDGSILCPQVSRRPPRSALGLSEDATVQMDRVKVVGNKLVSLSGQDWSDTVTALGGGPTLLKDGVMFLTTDLEELGPKGNDITRSCGRTAVGLTSDGQLILATASGYASNTGDGIKLPELAQRMKKAGAVQAINFDGGGSTDMAIRGQIVANGPEAGNYERPVGNALLIMSNSKPRHPHNLAIKHISPLPADGKTTCKVEVSVTTENGQPVADGTPIYGQVSRLGYEPSASGTIDNMCRPLAVTSNGKAVIRLRTLQNPGVAAVRLRSGYAEAAAAIRLDAGELHELVVERSIQTQRQVPDVDSQQAPQPVLPSPDQGNPDTSAADDSPDVANPAPQPTIVSKVVQLQALALDQWQNGLAQVRIEVYADGTLLIASNTDSDGQVGFELHLDPSVKHLTIKAVGLPEQEVDIAD